jgi:L-malate glycosyltransferase
MKILTINYEYPPIGGGGGVFCRDLAREFAKKHDVDILTSHFPTLNKNEVSDKVVIHRIPVMCRTSLHYATLPSLLSFPFCGLMEGISMLSKKKYDIMHTHFIVPSGPLGLILSRFFNVPNILSIHGSDIYNPSRRVSPHRYAVLRWVVRTVMNNATKIVAQSNGLRDCAMQIYRPTKDIDVIPLGIPEPKFEMINRDQLLLNPNKIYLISVGRLAKVKGYEFLITALMILRKKGHDVGLILIGDGPEIKALKKLTADMGLTEHVIFTGWLYGERKFQYLSASDIYVMSSLHEGFGLVLAEAMFCGLPIVATNRGGQTDIVKEGRNGILVQPSDASALADAISLLINDYNKRLGMGRVNKEDVKRYAISAVAERYLDLFDSAISKGV